MTNIVTNATSLQLPACINDVKQEEEEEQEELLSPVAALLKQPQQAVEEVPAMMRVLLPRRLRVTRFCRRV